MKESQNDRAELSDKEFLIELRGRFLEDNLTVGDLEWVEDRGFEILESDPEIKLELESQRDEMLASIERVLRPHFEAQRKIFDKFQPPYIPDFAKISITHPEILSLEISSPQVKQLAIQQEILEIQSNSLIVLHEIKSGQKRTWFEWALWCFAGVAMLASLASVSLIFL